MSPEQQCLRDAEDDLRDLEPYADALGRTYDGGLYLREIEDLARRALAYARAHCPVGGLAL